LKYYTWSEICKN